MSKKNYVVLRMPEDAWDTLSETLQMDAVAKNFGQDLRKEITKALGQVEVLETLDPETLKSDRKRERAEDRRDAAIARKRLKEIGR